MKEEKQVVREEAPITANTISDAEQFSAEDLSRVWKIYADQLKHAEKSAELSVMNQPYELKNDGQILIRLANSLQEDILDRFRKEFVVYLRNALKNNTIRLVTEIIQEESKERLYTSQDKFNYMARQNPKLMELKQRLGLEYDY